MEPKIAPYEDKTILAVWMPSMEHGVLVVNTIGCGYLLKQILPHGLQSDAYWFIFKNDSWLKQNLKERYPALRVINPEPLPGRADSIERG